MINRLIGRCPVCGDDLEVVRLECGRCHTAVEGRFALTKLARLDDEQLRFVETFLRVRGNIKEMERELGVSYPTVRSRLDAVLQAMGYAVEPARDVEHAQRRREILDQLQAGKIGADEAIRLLQRRR
ncbi:MAG: DUF2089 domain-containing protein [Armatimonadota bacterium]|nr:DUF2089 domain-containing protein [Armatimonadota bacterium]MDR5697595.1 DUF2089 domain-containing protein [Armatimonadota bacterium]